MCSDIDCVYMVRVFMDRELWMSVANDVPPSPGSPYHAVLRGQARHDLVGLWPNCTKMTLRIIRALWVLWRHVVLCPACVTALSDALSAMFVLMTSETEPLETKINLKDIQGLSSYRAVNTLRLGYINQSVDVVKGNNRCLF